MGRARRRWGVVVAATVLVLAAAACEPPPPDIVITVDDPRSPAGPCAGSGTVYRCQGLTPAIALGNELSVEQGMHRVTIAIPGHPQLDAYLGAPVITGNLRIVVDRAHPAFFADVSFTTLTVAAGATLDIDVDRIVRPGQCVSLFCPQLGETKFDVDGTLIVRSTPIQEGGWHIIRINPGGVAVLIESQLRGSLYWGPDMQGDGSQAILNAGTLILDRSSVAVAGVLGAITTVGNGQTVMKDSGISSPARTGIPGYTNPWGPLPAGAGDACAGTLPVSLGGNSAFDETCHLSGPGDHNGPASP